LCVAGDDTVVVEAKTDFPATVEPPIQMAVDPMVVDVANAPSAILPSEPARRLSAQLADRCVQAQFVARHFWAWARARSRRHSREVPRDSVRPAVGRHVRSGRRPQP
jgi:hypothetical protein